jgi:hypothetical protein
MMILVMMIMINVGISAKYADFWPTVGPMQCRHIEYFGKKRE